MAGFEPVSVGKAVTTGETLFHGKRAENAPVLHEENA